MSNQTMYVLRDDSHENADLVRRESKSETERCPTLTR